MAITKLVMHEQPEILAQLEEALVECIPKHIENVSIREPVYSLRIWYFGTDLIGDRAPELMLTTESLRQQIIVEKGNLVPASLWGADELDHVDGSHRVSLASTEVSALCEAWYKDLESRSGTPLGPLELQPFRIMAQRVAKRLNDYDWRTCLCTTTDFVMFAADGSHDFCNDFEEMVASVPAKLIETLRSQRLLGDRNWWKLD
jgi:hypothetical protein